MSCDCDAVQSQLMPFNEALTQLISSAQQTVKIETLMIHHALGRVLAEDIVSPVDVPPHDNSAMDGYAIQENCLNEHNTLTLIGTSFAGQPFTQTLNSGECVRIMTGAVIPSGADSVIMQEQVTVNNDRITFLSSATIGQNIRNTGEDIAQGAIVLKQGRKLRPSDIGLLASLGINEINTFAKVKVAILSTGDELVAPGGTLLPGQIFESNRFTVMAQLHNLPVDIIDLGIVPDNRDSLTRAFADANKIADVVVSSGGVSVGEADFVKEILAQMGSINFWKIAIKPGKPFAFGKLSDSHFIGLPGNPVSAAVTFEQLAIPFIKVLSGQEHKPIATLKALTLSDFKKRPGRLEFQRAIAHQDIEGNWQVTSTGKQGSGILSSLSKANCYVVLPENSCGVPQGGEAQIQLFSMLDN